MRGGECRRAARLSGRRSTRYRRAAQSNDAPASRPDHCWRSARWRRAGVAEDVEYRPSGLATIHANDCEHGLVRMQQLIDENAGITANPHVIAHSIDLCIFIEKEASIAAGRKVKQVALVERYDETRQKY